MIIAVYQDGNHVNVPDLESAFNLPGTYYVFSIGSELHMNREKGIIFHQKDKSSIFFKHSSLELIEVKRTNNSFSPFQFSIFDYRTDSIRLIYSKSNVLPYALSYAIKTIIDASQFPSWNDYVNAEKTEEYKSQIATLQKEIETLKKKNDQLQKMLQDQKDNQP
ncbi:MAG: hypothetical protein AB2L17_12265 [Lentimicrobium sp.]|jgi:hypothetical protein